MAGEVSDLQLQNAALDANSLAAVMNGAADAAPVVTRTGRVLRTLAYYQAQYPATIYNGPRPKPSNQFNWFDGDIKVLGCNGYLQTTVDKSIERLFRTKYAGLFGGVIAYVAPWGNDSTGTGAWNAPYATPGAVNGTTDSVVRIFPGTYPAFGSRDTDANSNRVRFYEAWGDGDVIIRCPGPQTSLGVFRDFNNPANWTNEGGNTFSFDCSDYSLSYVFPSRVTVSFAQSDDGLPKRVSLFAVKTDIDAKGFGFGWSFDAGTKKLFLRIGIKDIADIAPFVDILWGDDGAHGAQKCLMLGQKTFCKGITFYGTFPLLINGATGGASQGFYKNCKFLLGPSSGSPQIAGSNGYFEDCWTLGSFQDSVKLDDSADHTIQANAFCIRHKSFGAGDLDTYGVDQGVGLPFIPVGGVAGINDMYVYNNNAYTMHAANSLVMIDCEGGNSAGPLCGGTGSIWMIGCKLGGTKEPDAYGVSWGLAVVGVNGSPNETCDAWVDTCSFNDVVTGISVLGDSAAYARLNYYNVAGTIAVGGAGTNSSAVTYNPAAP